MLKEKNIDLETLSQKRQKAENYLTRREEGIKASLQKIISSSTDQKVHAELRYTQAALEGARIVIDGIFSKIKEIVSQSPVTTMESIDFEFGKLMGEDLNSNGLAFRYNVLSACSLALNEADFYTYFDTASRYFHLSEKNDKK